MLMSLQSRLMAAATVPRPPPTAAAFLRQVAKAAAAREGGQMDLHTEHLQELSVITRHVQGACHPPASPR